MCGGGGGCNGKCLLGYTWVRVSAIDPRIITHGSKYVVSDHLTYTVLWLMDTLSVNKVCDALNINLSEPTSTYFRPIVREYSFRLCIPCINSRTMGLKGRAIRSPDCI